MKPPVQLPLLPELAPDVEVFRRQMRRSSNWLLLDSLRQTLDRCDRLRAPGVTTQAGGALPVSAGARSIAAKRELAVDRFLRGEETISNPALDRDA